MRFVAGLAFAILVASCSSIALGSEPVSSVDPGRSATKSRDINGFALGMPLADVLKRVTVTFQQGELVQSTMDGIAYDFGVCGSGRVYRIESHQELGAFDPDKAFMDKLQSDLVAKYGTVTSGSPGNLSWELVEPVRFSNGEVHAFKTNWFSALVSGYPNRSVAVDLRMLDFRICWADASRANAQVRDAASDKVIF